MTKKETDQKVKSVADKIAKEYKPEKIILFGSFAWGEPNEDSDIDLLVVKKSDRSNLEMMRDIHKIISDRGEAADVLVYTPEQLEKSINKNKNLFLEDILRNGKVIYANPKSGLAIALPKRQLKILH